MDSKDLKKELEKMLEECGLNGKVIDMSDLSDESLKEQKKLIQFKVYYSENSNGRAINLEGGSFIEDEEAQELFGLSNKEIEEIYKPVTNAIQFCTDEFIKRIKVIKNN